MGVQELPALRPSLYSMAGGAEKTMILITGGMGFIGLHAARRFLDNGEQVVLTQFHVRREPEFIKEELGKRAHVETVDVNNGEALLDVARRYRVTGILHLAVPGLGALGPMDDFRTNLYGLVNVLDAAQQAGVKRICLASSIAAYASLPAGPFREDTYLPVPSTNPTEAFKKAWDILAWHFAERTGLDVVSLRMSGIFGPLYHSMANLPSRVCHAAVRGSAPAPAGAEAPLPGAGPPGAPAPYEEDEQDLCYVKDCATGIQLVQMADKLQHRIYNIGAGRAVKNRDVLAAARKVVPGAEFATQPGRSPRARENPYLEITRIHDELGYQPQYDIDRAVADYIGWLRDHPQ
jgi:UDP-glucose 4-epimerase